MSSNITSFKNTEEARQYDAMAVKLKPLIDIVREFSSTKRSPIDEAQTEQLVRIIVDTFLRRKNIAKIEAVDQATSIEITGIVDAYCSGAGKSPDPDELNALDINLSLAALIMPRGHGR